MINPVSYPPKVQPNGNGCTFQFAVNEMADMYETLPSAYIGKLSRVGAIAANQTIKFEWNTISLIFTAVATPDDSGTQISIAGSSALHHQQFCSNYILFSDFYISVAGNDIFFQARKESSDYNLMVTISGAAYTWSQVQSGSTGVVKPGYSAYIQTIYFDSILGTDRVYPDSDGNFIVNVSDFISQRFKDEFSWPMADSIITRSYFCLPYQVRFSEAYGSPVSVRKSRLSDLFYTFSGKLSDQRLRELAEVGESFWENLSTGKSFLNTAPAIKYTGFDIPEKLWFLVYFSPTGTIRLSRKFYFSDGTMATQSDYLESSATQFKVIEIPAGMNQSAIDFIQANHPDKSCLKMEYWLSNNGIIVSEIRTYEFDLKNQPYARQFLFKTEMGTWETFRSVGKTTQTGNVARNTIAYTEPKHSVFSPDFRAESNYSSEGNVTYVTNTGLFRNSSTIHWVTESFLNSADRYEIVNGKLIPIVLEDSTSFDIESDGDNLRYFQFSYRRIGSGNMLSSEELETMPLGEYSADFNNDFTN